MNKNFLEHYMKTKPDTNEQKYLFLVDNQEIAFAIIRAGYPAVTLLYGQQGYHDINTFIDYMDEITCTGTYQIANLYRSADSVKAFTDDMLCHKTGEKVKRSRSCDRYCTTRNS